MTQPFSKNTDTNLTGKKQIKLDLSNHYTIGLSLLKLMLLIAAIGLVVIGIYELCSGGTAG
jgi:hypothetical protein